jgi:hypothetical protein
MGTQAPAGVGAGMKPRWPTMSTFPILEMGRNSSAVSATTEGLTCSPSYWRRNHFLTVCFRASLAAFLEVAGSRRLDSFAIKAK